MKGKEKASGEERLKVLLMVSATDNLFQSSKVDKSDRKVALIISYHQLIHDVYLASAHSRFTYPSLPYLMTPPYPTPKKMLYGKTPTPPPASSTASNQYIAILRPITSSSRRGGIQKECWSRIRVRGG